MHINTVKQRNTVACRALVCLASLSVAVLAPASALAAKTLAITGATVETATSKGTIEDATILVKDGKIEAIGKDVKIPVAAQVVNASGKTIMPGIVDPYYVVTIGRNVQTSEPRTIVFNGRVFTIGGGSRVIATTFAKVADGLDQKSLNWTPAFRSGITTLHVVTGGYAQSLFAEPDLAAATPSIEVKEADGRLLVAVSNDSNTLDVLRKNLKPASTGSSSSSRTAASRSTSTTTSPTTTLWKDIREGKTPVFVNVNNASAVLHVASIMTEYPKAKVALVASGSNVYSTLKNLTGGQYTVILPPTIDTKPNSAYRVNVPKMLTDEDIKFAFSLSLGQSDFSAQQATPLFSAAMLIRAGLDRQAVIRALTVEPATLMGLEKEVGTLEVGKRANMLVFDQDPFAVTASIENVYVAGEQVND